MIPTELTCWRSQALNSKTAPKHMDIPFCLGSCFFLEASCGSHFLSGFTQVIWNNLINTMFLFCSHPGSWHERWETFLPLKSKYCLSYKGQEIACLTELSLGSSVQCQIRRSRGYGTVTSGLTFCWRAKNTPSQSPVAHIFNIIMDLVRSFKWFKIYGVTDSYDTCHSSSELVKA